VITMAFIHRARREIHCKIVYYGPGMGGKTANVRYLYEHVTPDRKGKMISLETESERTLFFDFLPLSLGSIHGYDVRLHVYSVPGQVFYDASRKLILRASDGVVFVADSQSDRFEANAEAVENLIDNSNQVGLDVATLPVVLQYNKRDMPSALPVATLRETLNHHGWPEHEAVARDGVGVFDTLRTLSKLVLQRVKEGR
jgi:mutual gliding-motility protein MglA